MRTPDLSSAKWFKSSWSDNNGGACVEVAVMPAGVAVRDTKDRGGPVLFFTPEEWTAFVAGTKNGEFDL